MAAQPIPLSNLQSDSKRFDAKELAKRTLQRRAVEAAIWGMPLVSVDVMRRAFFRDAGATYGDIMYFSKPSDWKFQFTTPNASTRYVYFNFNLKDGPVVLEVPPTVGAGLFGSLLDAWQVPLADVGPEGGMRAREANICCCRPTSKTNDRLLSILVPFRVGSKGSIGHAFMDFAVSVETSLAVLQRYV